MKRLLILLLLTSIAAQAQKPETIYPYSLQPKDNSYYTAQAGLWNAYLQKHTKDADAWRNYYNAMRYSLLFAPTIQAGSNQKLDKVVDDMGKRVPNTWQYYMCKITNTGNTDKDTATRLNLIKKGLKLKPDEPGFLEYYINYCEIYGHTENLKDLYTRLYQTGKYFYGIMECGYNILMSLNKNAIVFVSGDVDTYPLRILQEVKGIRTDVTIVNINLAATMPQYTKRLLKEKSIVINDNILDRSKTETDEMAFIKDLTLAINSAAPDVPLFFDIFCGAENTFPDSLYCTGLAYEFSPARINNVAPLKNNIENHFHLDYLDDALYHENGISAPTVERMKTAYVIPFAILYRHYMQMHESNDRTTFLKNYVMKYAAKMGIQKEMEDYLQGKRKKI